MNGEKINECLRATAGKKKCMLRAMYVVCMKIYDYNCSLEFQD